MPRLPEALLAAQSARVRREAPPADDQGVRYLFLKITVVLVEMAGVMALLSGIGLAILAVKAWGPGGAIQGAKLLLPDGRTLSFAEGPLLRFMSIAPGIGAALLGVLMIGVGQLCEVVLKIEDAVRKGKDG